MRYSLEITKLNFKTENLPPTPLLFTPEPKKIEYITGAIDFNASFQIATNIPESWKNMIEQFVGEINRYTNKRIKVPISFHLESLDITPFQEDIKNLTIEHQERFIEEGYIIEITKNAPIVRIWAENVNGIFYGIQTIYQILNNTRTKGIYLPSLKIFDYPDMQIRGVSDDISRGQAITKEGLKRFIIELSRFKMNHYFLYIEDTFQFTKHPSIGVNRGAFSKEDIQELSQFAQQYCIILSPIFESLGHMDNILGLPQYQNLAEFPSSDCLDVSNPKIYDFLDELYSELAPAFPSSHFNLACDESWELGKYRSHEYVQKNGTGNVYLQHYQKIYELARKYNKKQVYLYHDIAIKYKEVLDNLPKDVIFCYWDYAPREKYTKIDTLVQAGFRFVVKPSVHDYSGFFTELTPTETNTINLITYGAERGALGVVQSSWGDFRNEPLHENRLYGFILAGIIAWNLKNTDKTQFWKGISMHFFENDNPKILDILLFIRNLSDQKRFGRKVNFFQLWAHPFAWPTTEHKTTNFSSIITQIEQNQLLCDQVRANTTRNQNNIDALRFSLQFYWLFAHKEIISAKIQKSNDWINSEQQKSQIGKDLEGLAQYFITSRDQYREIWTRTCSDANLGALLENYNNIADIFLKKKLEIEQNIPWKNPNIPSYWIYSCKKKLPNQKLETVFRKDYNLESVPKSAFIQVICDSHAIIYVNGQSLGEMFSKRTLSVCMLNNTIKIFNIGPQLRIGNNTIAIHNINYLGGIGIINVYGEIDTSQGEKIQIISDSSWKSINIANQKWIKGEIAVNDSNVQVKSSAILDKPPFINGSLAMPDFKEGKPSYHTLMLCFTNQVLLYIPLWLIWLAKLLSKKAVKKGLII